MNNPFMPKLNIDWKNFLFNTLKIMAIYTIGSLVAYNVEMFKGYEFMLGWFSYSIYITWLKKGVKK